MLGLTYHVCELMAKVTEEDVAAVVKEKGYIVEFSDGVRRVDPSEIVFCDEENEILSEMEKMRK